MSIAAALENNLREHIEQVLPNVGQSMVDATRQECSRRSGSLWESIQMDQWVNEGSRYTNTISAGRGLENPDVARFQDEGTGIYGPAGTEIIAPGGPGHPMTFYWDVVGGWRSLYSSRGSPGTHYFSGDDNQAMDRRFTEALNANL